MKYIVTGAGTWPWHNADAKIPGGDRASSKRKEAKSLLSVKGFRGLGFRV